MDELNVDGSRPAVSRVAALPSAWTTETDRLVLLVLACDSFDGDTSAPGADHLAAWTGLGRSTVYDALRRLQQPTSERPALLVVEGASRGRRRTRYRLALPDVEPSGRLDGSDRPATVQQPSGPPDGSTPSTVQQPSGRPDSPFPSDIPTPRARGGVVTTEVRAALIAQGVGEGETDALIGYALDDPGTKSARRLLVPSYLAEARSAVTGQHQARRRADAASQLDALRADPDARRVVDELADSYAATPGLHLHHSRQRLDELAAELAERRPAPQAPPAPAEADPCSLPGPRLAAGGTR